MDCSKITNGYVAGQCGSLPTGGTGTKVWLFNYSDIDRSTSVATSDKLTTLALNTGATGYKYESIDNSTEGGATLNKGKYVNTYDHNVTLRIFNDEADAKKFLNDLLDARVVAIVERKTKGDNKFEVFGWDSGLKLSENTYNTTFTDNVAYAPQLATDDTSKEENLPLTCAMTESALNALCQSASASE